MSETPMDPVKAARLMVEHIDPQLMSVARRHPNGDGSAHMAWMLQEILKGEMSIGKANRWLGWAQCLAMVYNRLDLEQMKEINCAAR